MKLSIAFSLCFFIHGTVRAQSPVEAKVQAINGRASMVINGRVVNPMIYSLTDVPGGRWSWEELPRHTMQTFCEAGFKLFQVDLAFDHAWMEDGSMDMSITQKQLRGVLDVCPEAVLFIRFHVNAPKWWQKKHPEENTAYADTDPKQDYEWGIQRIIEDDEETPVRSSLASKKWISEASSKLASYLQALAALPESNAVGGIQVAGGVYGEWHYWGFIENEPDMSQPMVEYFRGWLKDKYRTDAKLRTAWSDQSVLIDSAKIPTLQERKATTSGVFRDPGKERKLIDYYEAQHTCVADDIIHFCRIVKEQWPRPIITGAFYGYYYAVFGREAAGGHLELQRVLKSPYIDYLSGPGTYYPDAVHPGDAYRSRSLLTSIRLHGKLWLDEMDQQPPLVPLKDTTFRTSVKKSIGTVNRNIIATFVQGAGLWFYDFGPSGFNGGKRLTDHGSWGWWDEPSVMKNIAAVKNLLDRQMEKPYKSTADVLLVHDTRTFYNTGSDRSTSYMGHWANNWIPPAIYKSGVVHDIIHVDDLNLINPDPYKVIVFVNTWAMHDDVRTLIKSKIASNGRHLIFLYAPGYSNEKVLDKKFMEEVVGMKFARSTDQSPSIIKVNNDILNGVQINVFNRQVDPLFFVDDRDANALGLFQDNKVGFARKTLKKSTSWYMALPSGDSTLWRYIFREAKAHIYSDKGDVIYGGSGVLAIHTNAGGDRVIILKNGTQKTITLPSFSTVILDAETGEQLLKEENQN
jgi:hypothetical protein